MRSIVGRVHATQIKYNAFMDLSDKMACDTFMQALKKREEAESKGKVWRPVPIKAVFKLTVQRMQARNRPG